MKLVDPNSPTGKTRAAPGPLDTGPTTETDTDTVNDTDLAASARRDGWTPFYRRLFLQVLAETGRVSRACEYARLSKQSAYALRARDPLFAAGWDAACELARGPLADALYEQAIDGVTETITRDGVVVAERHRHDSRLSIAVLHRLDKRCDRAAEQNAPHLAVAGQWDRWLDLIGKGDEKGAWGVLDDASAAAARDSQLGQLPLGGNPIHGGDGDHAAGYELDEHFWKDEDGIWITATPPPDGFDGAEHGRWGEADYSRDCAPAEIDLLLRIEALDSAAERRAAATARDNVLADLAAELDALDDPPPTD